MKLQRFISKLASQNAKAYLVGGGVRDYLRKQDPKDHDYCVTGISQEQFEELFPDAILQGNDFPVYRMTIGDEYSEVALARCERKVSVGHKGFVIHTSPEVTIEEDLARRDLSINAMAIDLNTGDVIDPFHGYIDLKDKIIRATTSAFKEDPLRVYRAARFAAKLGFQIEEKTLWMMNSLKPELSSLPIERVMEEMKKALLADQPSQFFINLKKAYVLDIHFPEIDVLVNYTQHPLYHPEGNVFNHTMQVIDAARYFSREMTDSRAFIVMLSALLHDIGKAIAFDIHPVRGTPTYIGHEKDGVPVAEQFLDRFNLQSMKKAVLFGVEKHMIMHDAFTATKPAKAVDFVEGKFEIGQDGYFRKPGIVSALGVKEYTALCFADAIGRLPNPSHLDDVLRITTTVTNLFNKVQSFQFDELVRQLNAIVENEEIATRLANDIIISAKHNWILEKYHAEHVESSLNIEELQSKYTGQDLGYQIHSDKRRIRTALMRHFRETMKGYTDTLKEG